MTNLTTCAWCGQGMAVGANGRPRRYCRRSHRQRAYEARRRATQRRVALGEALVQAAALRSLNDRLYVLETALKDAALDVEDRRDPEAVLRDLLAAAGPLRGARLVPLASPEA